MVFLEICGIPQEIRPKLARMSSKTLNLVLAKDGAEPLVLECFWEEQGDQEPILLLDDHVKNAKVRRRALCILLLLAKLRAKEKIGEDGILEFKDGCDYLTWIGSLGNTFKEDSAIMETWIRTHFGISRSFCIGQPATKRSPTETTIAKINYRTKVLHPNQVIIFSRNRKAPPEMKKVLEGADLLDFAAALEEMRWNQSGKTPGIECMLRNGQLYIPKDILSHSQRFAGADYEENEDASAVSADDLFLKTKAKLIKRDKKSSDSDFNSLVKAQLKLDFDEYRKGCEPFFNWVSKWNDPFVLAKETRLTNYQAKFFQANCLCFASAMDGHNSKLTASLKGFDDCEWSKFARNRVYLWEPLKIVVKDIFETFANRYHIDGMGMKEAERSQYRSIFMGALNGWWHDIVEEQRIPFLFGVRVAERLAFSDFLEKICMPLFYLPTLSDDGPSVPDKNWEAERLARYQFMNYSHAIRYEAFEGVYWMETLCGNAPENRIDFILGYRTTLKMTTEAWNSVLDLADDPDSLL